MMWIEWQEAIYILEGYIYSFNVRIAYKIYLKAILISGKAAVI